MVTFEWYNLDNDNASRELNIMINLLGFKHLEMFHNVLNTSLLDVKIILNVLNDDISYCKNYDIFGICYGVCEYRLSDPKERRRIFLNKKIVENSKKSVIEMLKIISDIYLIYLERLKNDINFLNENFFLMKRKNI